jgi:hypothetical protein
MTQNPDKLSQEDEKIITDIEKEREFEKLKGEENTKKDYIEEKQELDPEKTPDFDDEISDISSVSMEDSDRFSVMSDELGDEISDKGDEIEAKEERGSSIPTKEAIRPTPAPAISKKQMLLASNIVLALNSAYHDAVVVSTGRVPGDKSIFSKGLQVAQVLAEAVPLLNPIATGVGIAAAISSKVDDNRAQKESKKFLLISGASSLDTAGYASFARQMGQNLAKEYAAEIPGELESEAVRGAGFKAAASRIMSSGVEAKAIKMARRLSQAVVASILNPEVQDVLKSPENMMKGGVADLEISNQVIEKATVGVKAMSEKTSLLDRMFKKVSSETKEAKAKLEENSKSEGADEVVIGGKTYRPRAGFGGAVAAAVIAQRAEREEASKKEGGRY